MATSRVEAFNDLHEAIVEFFRLGGNQGEVHPMIENAYRDYRNRRAAEVKARQAAVKEEGNEG
jgi:hypothetical protein